MIKRILNKAIRIGGFKVQLIDTKDLDFYKNLDNSSLLYSQLNQNSRELISSLMPFSKSEMAQDLFAVAFSKNLEPKYFVEFGATDGLKASNTWLLEKKLGWKGILAEPARIWHKSLNQNRGCNIENKCIANKSGEIYKFIEVGNSNYSNATLSTSENYLNNGDWAEKIRKEKLSKKYEVETLSLNDLLEKYNAPHEIQFMSIDTEGSELDILKGFNFDNYKINSICVEHNMVKETRNKIFHLLRDKGYERVFKNISKVDDWYLLKN